jgi:myo-inositol-1-phosphate synthase
MSDRTRFARGKSDGNGALRQREAVRVAIVGVGNCASSFVQGVEFYRDANPAEFVPGLMHVDLGGYHIRDIEFSAAFDIDAEKVGKDLSEAIWAGQNNTIKFADPPKLGIEVQRGMTHDGLGKYLKEKIQKAKGETAEIANILRETETDVLVSYLPVGAEQATKWYVEQALSAGCAFVNCVPVFIARESYWRKRFEQAGLPTSSPRLEQRSFTAPSRGCSASEVCASRAPASSTSAATWTSTTCSSASGWSPRRSPRRTP